MQEFDFLAWGILPKDQRGARGFHPQRMGDRLSGLRRKDDDPNGPPNGEYQEPEEPVSPEPRQPSPPQRGRRASISHLPRQPLLPSTEKVVSALQNGDVETHIRNFARHLRRPDGDDQYHLEQLLDGLDELGIVDHGIYCRLVQRLAETLLEHCVGYLCADAFSTEVFISRKMHNVLRILWSICLYYPALQRLIRHCEQLFPALNNILMSTMKEIQKVSAQAASAMQSDKMLITRRGSLDSATKTIKVPTESLGSVLVATLSIVYNCLHGSRCREDMIVCCDSGLIRVVVDLLSRTRNVIVAEACVRILDILGEFGGSTVRMTMRDYQVMKITGTYWRTIIQTQSFIGESGSQMAEMIARLGENLRQSSRVYGGTWGNINQRGSTKRSTVMLRLPYVKMVRWCSSPSCNKNEAIEKVKFRLCSRCRLSRYCSEECQMYHWTHGHKVECYAMYEVAEASMPAAMVEGRC